MLSVIALDYFRQSPLLAYPLVALAIFMGVFFVVTVRTVLQGKHGYDDVQRLPLVDGESAQEPSLNGAKEARRG